MDKEVRVRFAPSPTGGLHIGGVRTILFNYLFAKQNNGKFILRIEDTDQSRFVQGAEEYILNCLEWCGLTPDEGQGFGGNFGPYRQSERKNIYIKYAQQLVAQGHAYYAFDTPVDLENKRNAIPNFQYNQATRLQMRNSMTIPHEAVQSLINEGAPHVIRIKMPENENVYFNDLIRGDVSFDTHQVDDKVLLKADGMPTYHLAVVVDDYLMKISHVFRGEEWLPSAPVHILLWKYLGWDNDMPKWAHLPLILKPDGKGKLSKRDGERLGFPVFALDWTDPKTQEKATGYKETGFLPQALNNLLALLGWNDSTEQEIFTMQELVDKFSLERVHKGGAKFDWDKAKWFNAEWIKKLSAEELLPYVKDVLANKNINAKDDYLKTIIDLVKERCVLLPDFYAQSHFFFTEPKTYDMDALKSKWSDEKGLFFNDLISQFNQINNWDGVDLENVFKELASAKAIKVGELMLPFRVMLVGGKFGPQVFLIAEIIGKQQTLARIAKALETIKL
ncbi:MAG: glutamate--tRNA ligase [Sphingobacteriales bacterium]|nr:MAG: glutamate--tRNA ligase [Sphingobacteriales bacterium]